MGKITTKSAALKSNLITKYLACYLYCNIQYDMRETSTDIYIYIYVHVPVYTKTFSRQYQTRSKQFQIKTTQKEWFIILGQY